MNPNLARCRVCGLLHHEDDLPWGPDGDSPTFNICECCGVEFGYEDSLPESARKYREAWLADGALWSSPGARPADWDLAEQLRHVQMKGTSNVAALIHYHDLGDFRDFKIIGVYESESKAGEMRESAGLLPGFRDAVDGFEIVSFEFVHEGKAFYAGEVQVIYRMVDRDDRDDAETSICGVAATEREAEDLVAALQKADAVEDARYEIWPKDLGSTSWESGYFAYGYE